MQDIVRFEEVPAIPAKNVIALTDEELHTLLSALELIPELHSHSVVNIYYKLGGKK